LCALPCLLSLVGCAQEEAKAPPVPVTKEMEEQARNSDKYLMEQMKGAGKSAPAAAKTAPAPSGK